MIRSRLVEFAECVWDSRHVVTLRIKPHWNGMYLISGHQHWYLLLAFLVYFLALLMRHGTGMGHGYDIEASFTAIQGPKAQGVSDSPHDGGHGLLRNAIRCRRIELCCP